MLEHDLLPRVVSGTSGGAIVAGYVATRTDDELRVESSSPDIACRHGDFLYPIPKAIMHYVRKGQAMDNKQFESVLQKHFKMDTFASAYKRTKRHVSITVTKVSGAGGKQRVRKTEVLGE